MILTGIAILSGIAAIVGCASAVIDARHKQKEEYFRGRREGGASTRQMVMYRAEKEGYDTEKVRKDLLE